MTAYDMSLSESIDIDAASGSGTRLTKLSPEPMAGPTAQVRAAIPATLVGLESTIDG